MRRMLILGFVVCLVCLPVAGLQADAAEQKSEPDKPKADAAKPAEKSPAPKKATVALITLSGSFPEGPTSMGLFGELQQSLSTAIRRIDQAAEDKDVQAVWLRISGLGVGRGKLHELRCAIGRYRKSGKPIYAELTSAGTAEYLLAAACDEIVMPPSGTLMLPGVRAEVTFYKGLFDKLGIEFDMLQMGKYKGAAEPYTRTEMSAPLRESMEALVDDTYDDMARSIGADRGMKDYKIKTLIDRGLYTAAAARGAGLVDQVVYADQFQQSLPKKLKVDEIDFVTKYKKKKVDTDFSGLTGMVKLMELMMGGRKSAAAGKQHRIAVVYAVGPIVEGKSATDLFGDSVIGSTSMVATLRKAAEDDKVAAIVLRIDSPGGSATGSDLIWRETQRIEKPIIASMGDVAGSGGYYIAMGADRIFAEPGTVTGSIGVVGGKIVLGKLYEKIGLKTEVISRGENSGSFSSNEPFTPEQRKAWTSLLKEIYRQFVSKAAQGRKMEYKELEALAQGRIYTGRMAKANGLIDELGTLKDAIAAAKGAAGLKADEEVDLLILPKPQTIFEQLFGGPDAMASLKAAAPEMVEVARKTRLFRRLFTEPALLWMPYGVKVK